MSSPIMVVADYKPDPEYLPQNLREFELVKPNDYKGPGPHTKFVWALGSPGVKAVFGKKAKVTEVRTMPKEKDGVLYLGTYHTSVLYFDTEVERYIRADYAFFSQVVATGKLKRGKGINYEIAWSLEDFNRCIDDLKRAKSVALDLETTGLAPFHGDEVVCIALGIKGKQWIIPLNHAESPFKKHSIQQIMVECLREAIGTKPIIAHNGKFDSLFLLTKYGVYFPIAYDTMLMHALLEEESPHGLKELASVHFGAPAFDISVEEKKGKAALRKIAEYAAHDVYYTRRLKAQFTRELKWDPALWRLFKRLVMPAAREFVWIEYEGLYVRREKMEEVRTYLQQRIDETKAKLDECAEQAGYKGHLPQLTKTGKLKKKQSYWAGSTAKVADFLFNVVGLKSLEKTRGGKDATSESVLKRLWGQHPSVELILAYREATKLMTFINSWTELMDENGRLHPHFKIHGARTGRLSCEEPNMQQVPRDKTIRSLIGAPPGWSLVEADLSQAELRVAAILSGDPTLKRIFQTGGDPHKETAEIVSHQNLDDLDPAVAKDLRKKAKAVNFGFLYGMGWRKFIIYARDNYGVAVTDNEAKTLRKRFFEKYHELPRWHERQKRKAHLNGYVRSLSGRIRHLPKVHSEDENEVAQAERQAINSPVQGLVSDLILMAIVGLRQRIPDRSYFRIVGNVHDALLFLVREDKVQEVCPIIYQTMVNPPIVEEFGINLTVPLDSEVEIGDWGSGTKWTS